MAAVKNIPYGVANFEQLRNENLYYVDKTMYLPLLENMSKQDHVPSAFREHEQLPLPYPSPTFRQKRICQHDAGLL